MHADSLLEWKAPLLLTQLCSLLKVRGVTLVTSLHLSLAYGWPLSLPHSSYIQAQTGEANSLSERRTLLISTHQLLFNSYGDWRLTLRIESLIRSFTFAMYKSDGEAICTLIIEGLSPSSKIAMRKSYWEGRRNLRMESLSLFSYTDPM